MDTIVVYCQPFLLQLFQLVLLISQFFLLFVWFLLPDLVFCVLFFFLLFSKTEFLPTFISAVSADKEEMDFTYLLIDDTVEGSEGKETKRITSNIFRTYSMTSKYII